MIWDDLVCPTGGLFWGALMKFDLWTPVHPPQPCSPCHVHNWEKQEERKKGSCYRPLNPFSVFCWGLLEDAAIKLNWGQSPSAFIILGKRWQSLCDYPKQQGPLMDEWRTATVRIWWGYAITCKLVSVSWSSVSDYRQCADRLLMTGELSVVVTHDVRHPDL